MKRGAKEWMIAVVATAIGALGVACSSTPRSDQAGGSGGVGGAATGGTSGVGGTSGAGGASGSGGASGASGAGGSGAEDGGPGDAGSGIDEACASLARVTCHKYSECLPWYVPLNFGDVDTCIKQHAATLCRNRLGLEDSSETVATTEACAAARSAATCAQWVDNDVAVSACLARPGKRPTGAACGTPSQCQTTNCIVAVGTECGRCGGPLVGEGGSCFSSSECAGNLQCIDLACGLPRGLGQRCPNIDACQYDLTCWYGQCIVGTSDAGEPCDANTACQVRLGLSCGAGICKPWQFAGPGESCNPQGSPTCRAGDCTPVGGSDVCVAAPQEGEACDHFANRFCLPSARCVEGFCKTPDFGKCK